MMVGVHSDWLVPIMTLLNITPELKHMSHEVQLPWIVKSGVDNLISLKKDDVLKIP